MKVKCPQCQKSVEWDSKSPFRPFCSKRCQLIDLGEWANEQHSIPAPAQSLDEQDIDQLTDLYQRNANDGHYNH